MDQSLHSKFLSTSECNSYLTPLTKGMEISARTNKLPVPQSYPDIFILYFISLLQSGSLWDSWDSIDHFSRPAIVPDGHSFNKSIPTNPRKKFSPNYPIYGPKSKECQTTKTMGIIGQMFIDIILLSWWWQKRRHNQIHVGNEKEKDDDPSSAKRGRPGWIPHWTEINMKETGRN